MENKLPLLSLCIPTNGRAEWVIPLLESIYSQKEDPALFEVVITDNAANPELAAAVNAMERPNLKYFPTESAGFTNQVDAFEKCSGLFCKMLNHRSVLLPGSIRKLLSLVERYRTEKPLIYCTNGVLKTKDEDITCADLDAFVKRLGIYASWSAGTALWREDLQDIRSKPINSTFPHTVFLFDVHEQGPYLIWDGHYHELQNDATSGGYNPFEAFGITFLDLMSRLLKEGRIQPDTFEKVRQDVFVFLRTLHFKEVVLPAKHGYILTDIPEKISVYYSRRDYRKMVLYNYFVAPFELGANKVRKIFAGLKRKVK